jgi:hypothetical protein
LEPGGSGNVMSTVERFTPAVTIYTFIKNSP